MVKRIILAVSLFLPAIAGTAALASDPPFTFVIIPDPQNMVQSYGAVWMSECQRIVDNRVSENIVAVLTEGDLVNNPTSVQFATSSAGLALIEATGIPVIPIAGNHDYDGTNPAGRALTKFNQTYGPAHFSGKSWYRGNFDGTNSNYYATFDVGSRKFLIVVIEFYPRPEAMAWASDIIDSNSDREAIVLTHGFLYSDGNRIQDTTAQGPNAHGMPAADASGEELWTNLLRKKKNVRAVLCGHVANSVHAAHRTDIGDFGNPVHQILINYQLAANGGDGWVGLMKFQPSLHNVEIRNYRTWAPSGLGTDPSVPVYTLDWPDDLVPPEIGIASPPNGSHVSGTITVNANVTDNAAVARVECYVDGTLVTTLSAPPFSFSWDSSSVAEGTHVVLLKAFDTGQNMTATQVSVITGTPPSAQGLFQPLFSPSRGECVSIPILNSKTVHAKARVFDRMGALVDTVVDTDLAPGSSVSWDGRNDSNQIVVSGVYTMILEIDGHVQSKKIIVRK